MLGAGANCSPTTLRSGPTRRRRSRHQAGLKSPLRQVRFDDDGAQVSIPRVDRLRGLPASAINESKGLIAPGRGPGTPRLLQREHTAPAQQIRVLLKAPLSIPLILATLSRQQMSETCSSSRADCPKRWPGWSRRSASCRAHRDPDPHDVPGRIVAPRNAGRHEPAPFRNWRANRAGEWWYCPRNDRMK